MPDSFLPDSFLPDSFLRPEGFSEALWYEVKPLGINVCLVQPGFIRSKSFLKVKYTKQSEPEHLLNIQSAQPLYADYYEYMTPFIERLMGLSLTTPKNVARRILKVIKTENPPLWIPATIDAQFFYYLRRLIPRRLFLRILYTALPNMRNWGRKYTHRRS